MYLLRIVLPDQPGALGTVASALGKVGGDIVAVDVVARQPNGTAVDDFLVQLPMGGRADELVSACQTVEGARVVWLSRYAAGADLHRDLEVVEAMTKRPDDAERILVDTAPDVFRGHWAMLVRTTGGKDTASNSTTEVMHATDTAPDLPDDRAPWLPLTKATLLDIPEHWAKHGWQDITAAAVPAGNKQALVLGRSGGPPILESELARLAHLASLARTIRRTVAATG